MYKRQVEAGISQPWWRWIGSQGRPVSIEHYGASADAATLFREFGFTPEKVVEAAKESLAAANRVDTHSQGTTALTDVAPDV